MTDTNSLSKPTNAPWRADIVGSFLRPEALTTARADFAAGLISHETLTAVEDEQIRLLVEKQKAHGLHVITDGEYRRSDWHLDFMWGLQGVESARLKEGFLVTDEESTQRSIRLTGRISGEHHPFVEHFKFLKQLESDGVVARQTIPAPAQLYAELFRGDNAEETRRVYPDEKLLLEDIAAAYQTVIADLAACGCKNIQLDDRTWGYICDKRYWTFMAERGVDVELLKITFVGLNNQALANRPDNVAITTHVCRGHYESSWALEGAYDEVSKYLFYAENVDAFYLEYDDERSGSFIPLIDLAEGKKVVLGLVTTHSPQLEDKDAMIARIREAALFVPLDRLAISPQCGFSPDEHDHQLTEEDQWNKIALIQDIAKEVWGE